MSETGDAAPRPTGEGGAPRPGAGGGSGAARPRGAPASRTTPDRRNVIVAACAGLVVVAVCLILTRGGGGGGADDAAVTPSAPKQGASTTTAAPAAQDRMIEAVLVDDPVPPGDYTKLCTAVGEQISATSDTPTFEDAVAIYRKLDFAVLLEQAPAGFRPILEVLQRDRDDVVSTLDQVPSLAELVPEDLPEDWLHAFGLTIKVIYSECPQILASVSGG